jgi:hypothetical protein
MYLDPTEHAARAAADPLMQNHWCDVCGERRNLVTQLGHTERRIQAIDESAAEHGRPEVAAPARIFYCLDNPDCVTYAHEDGFWHRRPGFQIGPVKPIQAGSL